MKEMELKLKVPEGVAKLYFQATPRDRRIALYWYIQFLKGTALKQTSKKEWLKIMKVAQREAQLKGMTIEKAKEILGSDSDNLF